MKIVSEQHAKDFRRSSWVMLMVL